MNSESIGRHKWLGISVALTVLLAGACFEEETDPCLELCQFLADCKLCLTDANKKCRTLQGCVDRCNTSASLKDSLPCIKNVKGCDKTQINACMAPPKKDGGVTPKDTGVVKKDGGGKGYRGKGTCKLSVENMKCDRVEQKTMEPHRQPRTSHAPSAPG